MRARFFILPLLVLLGACANKGEVLQTARASVASSAGLYAGAEVVFKTYAGLPRCTPATPAKPPLCSEARKVVDVGDKLKEARTAVDTARNVVNSLPGQGEAVTVVSLPAPTRSLIEDAATKAADADTAAKAAKAGS